MRREQRKLVESGSNGSSTNLKTPERNDNNLIRSATDKSWASSNMMTIRLQKAFYLMPLLIVVGLFARLPASFAGAAEATSKPVLLKGVAVPDRFLAKSQYGLFGGDIRIGMGTFPSTSRSFAAARSFSSPLRMRIRRRLLR